MTPLWDGGWLKDIAEGGAETGRQEEIASGLTEPGGDSLLTWFHIRAIQR